MKKQKNNNNNKKFELLNDKDNIILNKKLKKKTIKSKRTKTKSEENNLPKTFHFLNNIFITDSIMEHSYFKLKTFIIFKSINDLLYLIYINENNSIISYDLKNLKKMNEIKGSHSLRIYNIQYIFDKIKKLELIMTITSNQIKVWNTINWQCKFNYTNNISNLVSTF